MYRRTAERLLRDTARCAGRAPRDRADAQTRGRSYGYLLDARRRPRRGVRHPHRASVARQLATARRARGRGRRERPRAAGSTPPAAASACWSSTACSPFDMRVGDRTATELRRRRRPAPAAEAPRRRAARAGLDWQVLSPDALRAARRGVRRARAAVAADRAGAAAPGGATHDRPRRAAGDLVPAAARGAAGAAAVAPGSALGPGRAGRHPRSRCRSPTACSASWSAPSGRRSRTRWRASPRPGSSPARPATGTCTASSTSTWSR